MVAEYLLEHEKMDGETFEKMMKGEAVEAPKPIEPLKTPAAEDDDGEAQESAGEAKPEEAAPQDPNEPQM